VPNWEPVSQNKIRGALDLLGSLNGGSTGAWHQGRSRSGSTSDRHGRGLGGNPPAAAIYDSAYPKANDGKVVHRLTVKEVPVDGFWSITVYNARGYF
jgi:hypothetical protein